MKPLVLPPGYLHKTNEELGQWLVSAWMAYMADTSGIPRDAIPQETVTKWIGYGQVKGAGLIRDAQLESALRKAFCGDIVGAGKRVREHFTQAAVMSAVGDVARTGMKVRKPMQAERDRRSRGAASDAVEWQNRAASLWAMPQHRNKTAFDIARLIDKDRANTIRRKIQKP